MRIRLHRYFRISCVGIVGIAIGTLIEPHFARVAEFVRAPLHRQGDLDEALEKVIPEIDLEGVPLTEAVESLRKLSPVPIVVKWKNLSANGIDVKA